MIAQHLKNGLVENAERLFMIHGGQQVTYRQLAARTESLAQQLCHLTGKRVGVRNSSLTTFIPAILALNLVAADVFLLGSRTPAEINRLTREFSLECILDFSSYNGTQFSESVLAPILTPEPQAVHSELSADKGVTILTSGTTGLPKAARHTWANLCKPVRTTPLYRHTRWLCLFPLHLYAGLQVFLQAFLNWATLVIPSCMTPHEIASTISHQGIQYASGTPSLWRQILYFSGSQGLEPTSLLQITLGGEVASQVLLDQLRRVFPHTRIVHIYACTEMGRLFAVTDGEEGFPLRYLDDPPEAGVQLKIVDDQLLVTSRTPMTTYIQQEEDQPSTPAYFHTGDLVKVAGNRVLFRGRINEIVNVGGSKVSPLEVESVIRNVPGVAEVRVYPKPSSLTGHILAADIIPSPQYSREQIRLAIQQMSQIHLQPFQVPRVINFVDQIRMSSAFKISRAGPDS
ncbi:MAG: AMP-binding protein [Nitrospira sp. CR2.1]|nr:AMP-binding protein [Nitrospira sp. CR2.1]